MSFSSHLCSLEYTGNRWFLLFFPDLPFKTEGCSALKRAKLNDVQYIDRLLYSIDNLILDMVLNFGSSCGVYAPIGTITKFYARAQTTMYS